MSAWSLLAMEVSGLPLLDGMFGVNNYCKSKVALWNDNIEEKLSDAESRR